MPGHKPYHAPGIYYFNSLPVRGKEDAANFLADSVLDGKTFIEIVYNPNETNLDEILTYERKTRKSFSSFSNKSLFEVPIRLSNNREYRAIRVTYNPIEIEAKNFMQNWVRTNINGGMTDLEKTQRIVDYVRRNYCYQADMSHDMTYDYGRMYQTKHGICHEFTIFTNAMLHYAGIETHYVANNAYTHAWSMMKLDGQWYHSDVTWMKPIHLESENERTQEYQYKSMAKQHFLLSANDTKQVRSHQFDESLYPNAPSTYPRDQIGL